MRRWQWRHRYPQKRLFQRLAECVFVTSLLFRGDGADEFVVNSIADAVSHTVLAAVVAAAAALRLQVLEGMFALAGRLFGVSITPADGEAEVWNPDVKFFNIKDKASGGELCIEMISNGREDVKYVAAFISGGLAGASLSIVAGGDVFSKRTSISGSVGRGPRD